MDRLTHSDGNGRPSGAGMGRRTFVVHVHAEGPCTVEDLSTRERVAVADLATIGLQIEDWLERAELSLRSGPP